MRHLISFLIICTVIISCSVKDNAENNWILAKRMNLTNMYEAFINLYPNSSYTDSAKVLIEKMDFKRALDISNYSTFNYYLKKYPNSVHTAKVQRLLDSLISNNFQDIEDISIEFTHREDNELDKYEYDIEEYSSILLESIGIKVIPSSKNKLLINISYKKLGSHYAGPGQMPIQIDNPFMSQPSLENYPYYDTGCNLFVEVKFTTVTGNVFIQNFTYKKPPPENIQFKEIKEDDKTVLTCLDIMEFPSEIAFFKYGVELNHIIKRAFGLDALLYSNELWRQNHKLMESANHAVFPLNADKFNYLVICNVLNNTEQQLWYSKLINELTNANEPLKRYSVELLMRMNYKPRNNFERSVFEFCEMDTCEGSYVINYKLLQNTRLRNMFLNSIDYQFSDFEVDSFKWNHHDVFERNLKLYKQDKFNSCSQFFLLNLIKLNWGNNNFISVLNEDFVLSSKVDKFAANYFVSIGDSVRLIPYLEKMEEDDFSDLLNGNPDFIVTCCKSIKNPNIIISLSKYFCKSFLIEKNLGDIGLKHDIGVILEGYKGEKSIPYLDKALNIFSNYKSKREIENSKFMKQYQENTQN
jgi:hypothetical protein